MPSAALECPPNSQLGTPFSKILEMGRKPPSAMHLALYCNIFIYSRIQEIFNMDGEDILLHVKEGLSAKFAITEEFRQRHEQFVASLRAIPALTGLQSKVSSKGFKDEHGRALSEWKQIWDYMIRKSNFNQKLHLFLRSKEIDPMKINAVYKSSEENLRVGSDEDENHSPTHASDKKPHTSNEPSAANITTTEMKWVLEWLFGSDGFYSVRQAEEPKEILLRFAKRVYHMEWDREIKKQSRLLPKLEGQMFEVEEMWKRWNDPHDEKKLPELSKWMRLMDQARANAEYLCDEQALRKISEYITVVAHILHQRNPSVFEHQGICTLSPKELSRMAALVTPAELSIIEILWGDRIGLVSPPLSSPPAREAQILMDSMEDTIGVDLESRMSSEDLYKALGGINQGDFNGLYRMNYAVPTNGWDSYSSEGRDKDFKAQTDANKQVMNGENLTDPRFTPFGPRWDQLAGCHRILAHMSTPTLVEEESRPSIPLGGNTQIPLANQSPKASEKPHSRAGIFLGDEVGMGKTVTTLCTIAQLMHWVDLEDKGLKFPPVHEASGGVMHRLFGDTKIPRAPHLIVVPSQLIGYWKDQIDIILGKNADVFVYEGEYDSHKNFFRSGGIYLRSKHPEHRRIILVATTALGFDARKLLKANVSSTPKGVARQGFTGSDNQSLLNGREYGLMVVDEAHELRTGGDSFEAVKYLRDKSLCVLALSATPFYTSARDLRNIGRLLNISYFLTKEADNDEIAGSRVASKVRKLQNSSKKAFGDGSKQKPSSEVQRELQEQVGKMLEDVQNIRTRFENRIIRRTLKSRGEHGKGSITGLKDYWEIQVYIMLKKEEYDKLEEMNSMMSSERNEVETLVAPPSFYLRYRQGGINAHVVYAAWLLESPPDLYVSEKDFDERGSSKEKAVIKLIGHHSNPENHQSNPLNWSKEGTWEVTKRTPDPPIHTPTGIVKFVVYTEFVGMMPYIKSALDAHSISNVSVTGKSSTRKRGQDIEAFRTNNTQVLLLSNVGKVGINLSAANILIILDPLFSNQELRQIIGRVWRYPQRRQVIVYRLFAQGTADTTLQDIANNKDTLANAFNSAKPGVMKQILRSMIGEGIHNMDEEMEDVIDEESPDVKVKPQNVKGYGKFKDQKMKTSLVSTEGTNEGVTGVSNMKNGDNNVPSLDPKQNDGSFQPSSPLVESKKLPHGVGAAQEEFDDQLDFQVYNVDNIGDLPQLDISIGDSLVDNIDDLSQVEIPVEDFCGETGASHSHKKGHSPVIDRVGIISEHTRSNLALAPVKPNPQHETTKVFPPRQSDEKRPKSQQHTGKLQWVKGSSHSVTASGASQPHVGTTTGWLHAIQNIQAVSRRQNLDNNKSTSRDRARDNMLKRNHPETDSDSDDELAFKRTRLTPLVNTGHIMGNNPKPRLR